MKLTLEQKIGQLMMIGWQSDKYEDICELIRKYHFGNVILFTRNIKSSKELKVICEKIQEAALEANGVTCLISLDQEGGSVRRIYDGITNVPGSMAIGSASFRKPDSAKIIGKIMGEELKSIGVNFNLAPVADINVNPQNPVIAIRSFGDNPNLVSTLASQLAESMQEEGVLACYKHFIGHGDVHVDSHLELPQLNKTLDQLKSCELIPYMNKKLPDAIMTAHILYKGIDDKFPASISQKIIKGLLREELHYKGLVVTDCFEMDALRSTFSVEQAATFAVKATTDIITVSHTFGLQLQVRNGLIEAVKNGEITMAELDERVNHVLAIKEKYCQEQTKEIDFARNQRLAESVSKASICLASGELKPIHKDMVVIGVTNYVNSIAEDKNVENMNIAKSIGEEFGLEYHSIDNKNFNVSDLVEYGTGKDIILALSDSHLTLVQKVLYSSLINKAKLILLISLRTPYDILGQEKPQGHLCLFEYTKQSVDSLIRVLKGDKAYGSLPVRLDDFSSVFKTKNDLKNYLIDNVTNYINEYYAKNITLESLSEEFLISPAYLCKLFKKKLDINFIDYLNQIRISNAKKLLSSTFLKIYEISNLVGYLDQNYFTKVFKRIVGVTPNYYRNNFKIND